MNLNDRGLLSRMFELILFTFLFSLFSVSSAQAATLTMDPAVGKFGPGDTFVLALRIDPDTNECINAIEADVSYPSDWMKASLVSKGESVFTLWPTEPTIDPKQGLIVLNAGIPGGYCGHVQGDPGKTDLLARIVFTIAGSLDNVTGATPPKDLPVSFAANSRVLLNDGIGTVAPLHVVNAHITRDAVSHGSTNGWLDLVHTDTTPPDEFRAQVVQDAGTFQNKYFLVFSAIDKQSGVSHYEVREDDPTRLGFDRTTGKESPFIGASSPYVLLDQELKSRITIHALDQAGNTREEIIAPKNAVPPTSSFSMSGLSVGSDKWKGIGGATGFLVVSSVLWGILRRRKRSEMMNKTEHDDGSSVV